MVSQAPGIIRHGLWPPRALISLFLPRRIRLSAAVPPRRSIALLLGFPSASISLEAQLTTTIRMWAMETLIMLIRMHSCRRFDRCPRVHRCERHPPLLRGLSRSHRNVDRLFASLESLPHSLRPLNASIMTCSNYWNRRSDVFARLASVLPCMRVRVACCSVGAFTSSFVRDHRGPLHSFKPFSTSIMTIVDRWNGRCSLCNHVGALADCAPTPRCTLATHAAVRPITHTARFHSISRSVYSFGWVRYTGMTRGVSALDSLSQLACLAFLRV